jgi:hypothetical protein
MSKVIAMFTGSDFELNLDDEDVVDHAFNEVITTFVTNFLNLLN